MFLNQIHNQQPQHQYKVAIVHCEFADDRPEDLSLRIARAVHQQSPVKTIYFTEDVLSQIQSAELEFEKKPAMFIKPAQKEMPVYSLTRFDEAHIQVDPTDLFDFSQVDTYTSVPPALSATAGEPAKPVKNIFESSNTTIEIDPVRKKISAEQQPYKTPTSRQVISPKIPVKNHPSKIKSIAIIATVLIIVSFAGYYMSRSNKPAITTMPSDTLSEADKPLPIVETPTVETATQQPAVATAPAPAQEEAPAEPAKPKLGLHEALISVHSTPKGAKVWINGKEQKQTTPIDNIKVSSLKLTKVEVSKAGFQKASKKVELRPQQSRTTMFNLTAIGKPKKKTTTPKKK